MKDRNPERDQSLLTAVSFIVMDFETVTPAKRPPEPIELAALRIMPGLRVDQQWKADWLIKPPDGAPLTAFDTRQTGIREADLAGKPAAAEILRAFETLVCQDQKEDVHVPTLLVAHHASYDAQIIWRYAECCPTLAALPCVDTIALARQVVPHLSSYRLDELARSFSLPIPPNRHRSLPDVQLTIQILLRCLHRYLENNPAATVADLLRLAGITRTRAHVQKEQSALQMALFAEEKEKEE